LQYLLASVDRFNNIPLLQAEVISADIWHKIYHLALYCFAILPDKITLH